MVAPSSLRATAFLQHAPIHNATHALAPHTSLSSHKRTGRGRSIRVSQPARVAPRLTAAPEVPADGQAGQSQVVDKVASAPEPSVVERPEEFWTEQWYPIAFADDVPLGKLYTFRLFDRPYVLFKDEATSLYVVMDDVCPHRAVPLSEGRLLSKNSHTLLECAYHGWQFDCSGTCTAIPGGGPDFRIPAAAHIRGLYATSVTRSNLVFFFPGDRLRADKVPIVQPNLLCENDPDTLISRSFSRMLPLPYEILVENIVDPGHVPFAHHGTDDGNRDTFMRNANAKIGQTVTARDDARGEIETDGNRSTYSVVATVRGGGTSVTTVVESPVLELHLVFHIVPSTRGTSNIFAYRAVRIPRSRKLKVWLKRALIAMPRPRWVDHCRGHVVLDGDTPYLRNAETALRNSGKSWREAYTLANGTWDATVVAWRKWFDRFGETMPYVLPPGAADLAPMTDREINDRVRWHGQDCVSCAGALRNFRTGRQAAAVIAVIAAASAVAASMLASALAATGQTAVARRVAWGAFKALLIALVAAAVVAGCQRGVTALTYTDRAKHLLNS